MKNRKFYLILAGVASMFFLTYCDSANKEIEFQENENGIRYKIYTQNEDQPVAAPGEIVSLKLTYGSPDSTFYNTDMIPEKVMKLPMSEPAFPGDLFEAIAMMHKGDSGTFVIPAETFFLKTAGFRSIPPFAEGLESLTFNIKLENIQSEDEVQKEYDAKMLELKIAEDESLEKFVAENNITATPTESGLYFVEIKKGSGAKPQVGETVQVHYTGTLLDGKKFDSSVDRGKPFEFPLGQGRVIKGWDEGIALMSIGSKAKLIIPSYLGYGERGAGADIPPYAPLVFEVELLDIIKK